ncbi:SET and MYND domain-containing protein 4-like [Thrips palmi]|uniref:Protein-lysine N-methyltransferase SMYD4 n=1 Tax=Thrips palmi TaxID=161013 RepID=A0A6P8Z691_THRPL|nr:SET and MYND domain-containing protein 4-like [Thrips palmi]
MYLFEDTIFERLLDALKVGDRVVVTSHLFYEFKTNTERVALAYQLLEEENLLPILESGGTKSPKLSTDLRNEGNKAFQKKNDLLALHLYNRSLCAAPVYSKEYALAIGNRSAVNLSLGFFNACLSDIELAHQSSYPNELRVKLLERQVKCFIQLDMVTEAEAALKTLETEVQGMAQGKREQLLSSVSTLTQDLQRIRVKAEGALDDALTSCNEFGCFERPPLSHGSNEEIKCASTAIALKYSEDKGRHLIASENIRPGDVLIVEQPFASVLLPAASSTHCYFCLNRCLSPIPCLHCTEVMFCNEKCRVESWTQFHSIDCSLLPVISNKVGKMGLLALRVLLLASQKGKKLRQLMEEVEEIEKTPKTNPRTLGFNKDGRYLSTDYWPIHFLIGHSDHRSNADIFRRSVTAACLLHCLETFTKFFEADLDDEIYYFCGGLLLHHLQSLPCNAHEVSEMSVTAGSFDSQEVGAAAYATLSLLNHSCDPNVVRHSYGDWAVLRAIRPIQQGEEILDNYGYHHALHTVDERRSQLSKQYFFHCSCEACLGSWPSYKDQPTTNPVFRCNECGSPIKKGQDPQCTCGAIIDMGELELNLAKSSKLFRETLASVWSGKHRKIVPDSLLEHLTLLAKTVKRPWREFSECQETIKQCLSLQANHVTIDM